METTTERTAFGRILSAIMEARGIPAEPEEVRALAERSGIDAEKFLALATSAPLTDVGPLDRLADELRPNGEQKLALAMAYAYDRDVVVEAIRRSDDWNNAYFFVEERGEGLAPADRGRVLALLREEQAKAAKEAERLRLDIDAGPA